MVLPVGITTDANQYLADVMTCNSTILGGSHNYFNFLLETISVSPQPFLTVQVQLPVQMLFCTQAGDLAQHPSLSGSGMGLCTDLCAVVAVLSGTTAFRNGGT